MVGGGKGRVYGILGTTIEGFSGSMYFVKEEEEEEE